MIQNISQKEAKEIMDQRKDIVILDVRGEDEYREGHVVGAICIPNNEINATITERLEDKDQTILVYCLSGIRSAKAATKLDLLGYTDVRSFGGINTWEYEIEV